MFTLDWDDIKEEGLTRSWEQPAADFPALAGLESDSSCHFVTPVSGEFTARWIADLLEISGVVRSTVEISCSRCLKHYKDDIAGYFSLTFTRELPEIENLDDDDEEIELTPDDLGLIHVPEDEIDLHHPAAEQLIMALPVRPLCGKDCAGLCSHCGQDLNQGSCSCEKPIFNNKFAALKNLKVDK